MVKSHSEMSAPFLDIQYLKESGKENDKVHILFKPPGHPIGHLNLYTCDYYKQESHFRQYESMC